jgi:hypothetical protein
MKEPSFGRSADAFEKRTGPLKSYPMPFEKANRPFEKPTDAFEKRTDPLKNRPVP